MVASSFFPPVFSIILFFFLFEKERLCFGSQFEGVWSIMAEKALAVAAGM